MYNTLKFAKLLWSGLTAHKRSLAETESQTAVAQELMLLHREIRELEQRTNIKLGGMLLIVAVVAVLDKLL